MNDGELYREQGYVLARGVFDEAEVEEMRGAIDRILESVAGSEHDETTSGAPRKSGTRSCSRAFTTCSTTTPHSRARLRILAWPPC